MGSNRIAESSPAVGVCSKESGRDLVASRESLTDCVMIGAITVSMCNGGSGLAVSSKQPPSSYNGNTIASSSGPLVSSKDRLLDGVDVYDGWFENSGAAKRGNEGADEGRDVGIFVS